MRIKAFLVFGTRPEAIKMCPLALELKKHPEIDCKVCLTGQHREMLRQVMDVFGLREDYNLDIMRDRQTLTTITTSILEKMEPILTADKPDVVLVHGDTTTSFAAALATFYKQIPVGHVEAGLRTGDIYSPYPEEMNRLLTDRISTYYFAPTELNRQNLEREGIVKNVFITGNTVIDAFAYTVKKDYHFHDSTLADFFTAGAADKKIILLTAHRRENLGAPLEQICLAVRKIAETHPEVTVIYPVHLNPAVQEPVHRILDGMDNVLLISPVDVMDMHNLISRCYMVMTDSGGLQEEAPSFGKPVLVLRTETERPEAVVAGTVRIVGVNENDIRSATNELLESTKKYDKMANAVNPYGDGSACGKIAEKLINAFVV